MRMIETAIGHRMRLRKALSHKEQSRHQDHKGLYERGTRHHVTIYRYFKLAIRKIMERVDFMPALHQLRIHAALDNFLNGQALHNDGEDNNRISRR